MITINGKEALEELKKRYNNDKVSLLVGAGFSKNAWKSFPMWDGLLYDMVKEMYGSKKKIDKVLKQQSYLDIVSDYIKKKGMRESVEYYIEKHIPYIKDGEQTLRFPEKKAVRLSDEDFTIHRKLLSSRWQRIYTTNYDELLDIAGKQNGLRWRAISSADDLTINDDNSKLIVKLHGTIFHQDSPNHRFEFDGNHHHRYIISKEDYDNYPKEHEAFTQLMRISLLQGTFCLIGFSGNDPNFVSWLEWMRDVLIRSPKEYNVDNAKVFLIDVLGNKPSPDQQLFYINHHIVYVSLREKDVLNVLNVDTNIMNIDDKDEQNRHLMERFISFLNAPQESIMEDKESIEEYSSLWYKTVNFRDRRIEVDSSLVEKIMQRMENNRFVIQDDYQKYFLSGILRKETLSPEETSLVLIALKETGLPLGYYPELEKRLHNTSLEEWQKEELLHLEHRNRVLSGKKLGSIANNSKFVYDKILQFAFCLDFSKLYSTLSIWKPYCYDKLKKTIWMYFMGDKECESLLEDYKKETDNIQEEYWATEYLRVFTFYSKSNYSTVKYANMGLQSMYKVKDSIIDACLPQKENIKPYGESQNRVYRIGKSNTEYEHSVKALQFLMNFPYMPSIGIITMISPEKWYHIFRGIYEIHPYPALFYSLTINDKKVLRRIGQDFCYSDNLFNSGVLDDMGRRLIKGILDDKMPNLFRTHAYIVFRELLNVIKVTTWESGFMEIWRKFFLPVYGEDARLDEILSFVEKGVSMIELSDDIKEVVKDCLIHSKKDRNKTIGILYYVHTQIKDKALNLNDEISQFIENIDDIEDVQILGNINECLTEEHKQKLCDKILALNEGEIVIKDSINALCYLAKDNPALLSALKKAILSSKRLWDNAILKDGAIQGKPLNISQFDNSLKWTYDEVIQIYNKLKISVDTLLQSKLYKDEDGFSSIFGHYDNLFLEMVRFIELHRGVLEQQDGFAELYAIIQNELNKTRGFIDIEDGLLSDDKNEEADAMKELVYKIRNGYQKEHDNYVEMIADRILYNKKEGFEVCLNFLSYILKTFYKDLELPKSLVHKIQLILKRNEWSTLADMEVDLFKTIKYLISLAKTMEKFQMASDDTKKWINFEKSNRFYFKSDD